MLRRHFCLFSMVVGLGAAVIAQTTQASAQTTTPAPTAPQAPSAPVTPAPSPPVVTPPAADAAPSAQPDLPTVIYDVAQLPPAVRDMRQRIIDATKTGDVEALRPIIASFPDLPIFPGGDGGDPITTLKLLSGDEQGHEILAILQEVLEAGFVHVDPGTPQELYIWPYFARYPLGRLSGPQMVELFRLIGAGDFVDMQDKGVYSFYRAGFAPDGTWRFFEDGD